MNHDKAINGLRPGICKVPGCNGSSLNRNGGARQFCRMHYQRWYKYGDPTISYGGSEFNARLLADLIGKTYGRWLILRVGPTKISGNKAHPAVICQCTQCGTVQTVRASAVRLGHTQGCQRCAWSDKVCVKPNEQYGLWTVIDIIRQRGQLMAECRCKCGRMRIIRPSKLRTGKSTRCKSCKVATWMSHRECAYPWKCAMTRIIANAQARDIEVRITTDDIKKQYDLQGGLCALTGQPIGFAPTLNEDRHGQSTASLDRIDSQKPYTRENIQWVHKTINLCKMDLTQDEFIDMCKLVASHASSSRERKY